MPTKDEEAVALAQTHYEVEAGLTHVFRIIRESAVEAMPAEPIKLLEVNENTVPSGILPIHFGPSPASGLHYPMVILEVTPEEYQIYRTLALPSPYCYAFGRYLFRSMQYVGAISSSPSSPRPP